MKNSYLKICLTITALLGGTSGVFAHHLPACPSSGYKHNCFGTYIFIDGSKYVGEFKDGKFNGKGTATYISGNKYVGEWKDGKRHGQGISYIWDGQIWEGIWKDDRFQYAQKTPYSNQPSILHPYQRSVLHTAFNKLSKNQRKQLQLNLKDLGFYKSSIDGLYGKGME